MGGIPRSGGFVNVLKTVEKRQNTFPVFYGIFGEAIRQVIGNYKNYNHPLVEVVKSQYEALWEKELLEAITILNLNTPDEFVKTYELHPNHVASSAVNFWAFMAEIYVLFSLDSRSFKNIKKVKTQDNTANPDYTAERCGIKFVIEVWKREQDEKAEEHTRINPNGLYNITQLNQELESLSETKLPKFEKQMADYEGYKKVAAIYLPGKMLGYFADNPTLIPIGTRLLGKANGKVDHFLFRFRFESLKEDTKTFIVPDLPKCENK